MLEERLALTALNMVGGMGAVTAKKLIDTFGSAAAAFTASVDDLKAVPGIGSAKALAFAEAFHKVDPLAEEDAAAKLGIRIIAWNEPDYPAQLKQIYDPPLVLYICGDVAAFRQTGIAMVGTRTPSHYGMETAHRFGYQLAAAGLTVVSGMARGIDAQSHRGAVDANGRTIAVLGGAINCFYPQENRELGRKVIQKGGLVISEYPLGRQPDKQTFPMRNRIISGLSNAVLVVESALHSGTMITVDQALDQGRVVMAIPGRIDSPTSQGCHKLLRNGAKLITCVDDVLDEIQNLPMPMAKKSAVIDINPSQPVAKTVRPALSAEEEKIVEAVGKNEILIDDLANSTGIDVGRLNGMLIALQIKRVLKIIPGGRVTRALPDV